MKLGPTSYATDPFNYAPSSLHEPLKNPHCLVPIKQSKGALLMCSSSIVYARAEHVYVEIYFGGNRRMLHRDSLAGFVKELPGEVFMRVHRSYVVNLKRVDGWRSDTLFVGETAIPISRNRRQEVLARLQSL